MTEESAKETETTRVVYFDGTDKTKLREWKLKTLIIGHVKNWKKAFQTDSKIFELEAKEEKTTEDIVKINANSTSWIYPIMACKGKAFNIITGVPNKEAFKAWTKLKMQFEPTQAKYIVTMIGDFNDLVMEDELEDPTIYFKALDKINKQFESMDPTYKKNDTEMITFMFAKIPKSYATSITSMILLGIDQVTLDEVSDKLENYWSRFIKQLENKIVTKPLTVEKNAVNKPFKKKFKGTCNFCHIQDHKEQDWEQIYDTSCQ
jgi:hypothetical protein